MAIKNYTTSIAVEKTIGDLQKILTKAHATAIMTDYDNGFPSALTFRVLVNDKELNFRLPVDVAGVQATLKTQRVRNDLDHARRVAWRIIKDWVDAQMALIESSQAKVAQVFLPYVIADGSGKTLYETMIGNGFLRLEGPK